MTSLNITLCALVAVHPKTKPNILNRCLQTLVEQTRPPDEIRLVFEKKIPNPLNEVVRRYSDVVIDLAPVDWSDPCRLAKCLNYSSNQTTCTHLVKVDVDDYNFPERFDQTYAAFKECPELKLIGSQMLEWDELLQRPVGQRFVPTELASIKKVIYWRNPFNGPTVTLERHALVQSGGFPLVSANEDYACWSRFVQLGYLVRNSAQIWVIQSSGMPLLARRHRWSYRVSEWKTLSYLRKEGIVPRWNSLIQGVRNFIVRGLVLKAVYLIYRVLRKPWRNAEALHVAGVFFRP